MSSSPTAAPRILIRRLRSIMADSVSVRERLDRIVSQIAGQMVAEVSSIYARRGDGSHVLIATEGLNTSAVGTTRMARGEGLVGLISEHARTVNLPDAQSHPAFSLRPETGEEIYASFLGVPVLRAGRVVGVVTVQNKASRTYSGDEEEALQTTAMVIAELLANAESEDDQDDVVVPLTKSRGHLLRGTAVADGLALGHVVLHEPRIVVEHLLTHDVDGELEQLTAALTRLRSDVKRLFAHRELKAMGDHHDIFAAYRMFADDRGWARRLEEAVRGGLTCGAAVERVRNQLRAKLVTAPTIGPKTPQWDRVRDIDDLSDRLLRILAGVSATAASDKLPRDAILVARGMGAADLLDYDRTRLRGVAIEEAGHTSHVAIVARALGLVCLSGVQGAVDAAEPGDDIILDGATGELHLRPGPDVVAAYADKARFRARKQEVFTALRDQPAVSRDGQRVELYLNAGLRADLPQLAESGAQGIGLFRTELEFMISPGFLGKDMQREIYRSVLDGAGNKPVVFRMLDLGSDKALPYAQAESEANPALGWRAIRRTIDRPGVFRTQTKALLRAAAGRELHVMLPMVTDVTEVYTARNLIERECELAQRYGHALPCDIKVGAMLEVPALLWQLPELCAAVDFISIGSNDLQQFFFAADRVNERVAGRYDPLSFPLLRALREVIRTTTAHGTPLSLCGEIAGTPLEAMALVAIGMRRISMAPASVGPVKLMIRSLDITDVATFMDGLLADADRDIRGALTAYARDHNVALDLDAAGAIALMAPHVGRAEAV